MGIVVPDYHLKAQHDLPHLRARLKGEGRRRIVDEELSLTSLIDVFSILLFFLMQGFSASGEIFFTNKDIHLPAANYAKELNRAPVVTITAEKVVVEGLRVGDNSGIDQKIEETDWELPKLSEKLAEYKRFYEEIHQGAIFPGQVIIQADKNLNFIYLKRVMFTLVKIGFGDIRMAVAGEAVAPSPSLVLPTPVSPSHQ